MLERGTRARLDDKDLQRAVAWPGCGGASRNIAPRSFTAHAPAAQRPDLAFQQTPPPTT